jgi:hypothetical protein
LVHRRLKRLYAILCAGRGDPEIGQPPGSLNQLTRALEDELAAIVAVNEELAREMDRLRAIVVRQGRTRELLSTGAGSGDSIRRTGAVETRVDALFARASGVSDPIWAEEDWREGKSGRNRTTSGHGRLPVHRYRRSRGRVRPWAAK